MKVHIKTPKKIQALVSAAVVGLSMMIPVAGMAGDTIKLGVAGAHSGFRFEESACRCDCHGFIPDWSGF